MTPIKYGMIMTLLLMLFLAFGCTKPEKNMEGAVPLPA
jgi:hypothetical protein